MPYQCLSSNEADNFFPKNTNYPKKEIGFYNNHIYHNKYSNIHTTLTNEEGSLSSYILLKSGIGGKRCPWWISVSQGKRINFTLEDFGVVTRLPATPSVSTIFPNHQPIVSSNNASRGGSNGRRLLMYVSQPNVVFDHVETKLEANFEQFLPKISENFYFHRKFNKKPLKRSAQKVLTNNIQKYPHKELGDWQGKHFHRTSITTRSSENHCQHFATLKEFTNGVVSNITQATSCSTSQRHVHILTSTSSQVQITLLPVTFLNFSVHYIIKYQGLSFVCVLKLLIEL